MLTASLLSGDTKKLGKYYNGIENYYYNQGLKDYKNKPDFESLGYVSVYPVFFISPRFPSIDSGNKKVKDKFCGITRTLQKNPFGIFLSPPYGQILRKSPSLVLLLQNSRGCKIWVYGKLC